MLSLVAARTKKAGLEPYYLYRQKNIAGNLENVGYSKPGLECIYNILIMEESVDTFAAGAGAVTRLLTTGDYGQYGVFKDGQCVACEVADTSFIGDSSEPLGNHDSETVGSRVSVQKPHIPTCANLQIANGLVDGLLDCDFFLGNA